MKRNQQAKTGFACMLICYCFWGFQPLYWNLTGCFDASFLMGARAVSAALFCLLLVAARGKLRELKNVFSMPRVLLKELFAAIFLFGDWFVFLWAVQNAQVLECSVGYYVQPLVVFAFGALIFHEKCRPYHFAALAFVAVGIIISAFGLGRLPWVSISLSLMFSVYAAIKKSLCVDSIVSTTAEILLMVPLLLTYLLVFRRGSGGFAEVSFLRALYLLGAGLITAAPMLLYAIAVNRLSLMTVSISQYLSPTLGIACSLLLGEEITPIKLASLAFIWVGIALYTVFSIRAHQKI